MTRKRKLQIVAGAFAFVVLVAVCVPFFIPDRETANLKAMMKNLAEPSKQAQTNATTTTPAGATNTVSQGSSDAGQSKP
jgi:predicted secreted acid phosphatase